MEIPQTDAEIEHREKQKKAFNDFMFAFINAVDKFYQFDKLHKNFIHRND